MDLFFDFFDAIPAVYNLTPESNTKLREVAIRFLKSYKMHITKAEEGCRPLKLARENAMMSVPAFGLDICNAFMVEA